jgi:virulence factor Mce-like protein
VNRQRSGSISGSPVLIGAVTAIVTMVAVFLSYNANEGLPFVPTYSLTAEVPNASGLVKGNEVRMGGTRVGVVTKIETAPQKENGDVSAHLALELDERVAPLPRDSTIIIRPRSALGLKFVELTKGRSEQGFEEGNTIPLAASKVETREIDDFFNMFDDPTRQGSQTNLATAGAAFAGRGESLNRSFAQLGPLVEKLEPAMRNLAAPRTGFAQLFPALEQAARQVAPIAGTQASMWAALDTTFTAWAGVSDSLQETIVEGPPSMDVAIREFPRQRPFLHDSEELFRRLRPAFASLAAAAPDLATAFRAGEPALLRSPGLNRRLTRTLSILDRFGDDERVPSGLARLTSTAQKLRPTLAFLTPAQTVCNYGTLLFRNLASATSEGDVVGSMLRISPMGLPQDRPETFVGEYPIGEFANSESGPASAPANGPVPPSGDPRYIRRQQNLSQDSFLHSNPYPTTAAPGQSDECEAGNDSFDYRDTLQNRQVIGNVPGITNHVTEKTERKGVRR